MNTLTSTNQTSLILLSLDKTLADNFHRLNRQEQQSLTQAVLNTLNGVPVAETVNEQVTPIQGEPNVDILPNSQTRSTADAGTVG